MSAAQTPYVESVMQKMDTRTEITLHGSRSPSRCAVTCRNEDTHERVMELFRGDREKQREGNIILPVMTQPRSHKIFRSWVFTCNSAIHAPEDLRQLSCSHTQRCCPFELRRDIISELLMNDWKYPWIS